MNAHPLAEVVRMAMVSLSFLLVGLVGFGLYQTWRDRHEAMVRRLPTHVTLAFAVGYLALLVNTAVQRFEGIGARMTFGTYFSLLTLLVNVTAVGVLVYYRRDEDTPSVQQYAGRRGVLPWLVRLIIYRQAMDDARWQRATGQPVHPGRRELDSMLAQQLVDEASKAVESTAQATQQTRGGDMSYIVRAKSIFASKVFWVNAVVLIVALVDTLALRDFAFLNEEWWVMVVAAANIGLRLLTNHPVSLRGGDNVTIDEAPKKL